MSATSALELVSKAKCFNGYQKVYRHFSKELDCSMKFALYEPETPSEANKKFHVLFYLSGLTCNEENFIHKSGFQKYASEHQLMVVGPDTSPRGLNLPGEKDSWEIGEGAGFYVDALLEPWANYYRMYSYVTSELPKLIQEHFPTTGNFGIFGHSMGGHGAMVCGLRNPTLFKSISAFAPICNPSVSKWGRDTAFRVYFGEANKNEWAKYDSCELVKSYNGPVKEILVDQGTEDDFLDSHLMPINLKLAAESNSDNIKLNLRMQNGFNHSYYFIASFVADHIKHHAQILNNF
jgi:S-formylglutathione hydrolase